MNFARLAGVVACALITGTTWAADFAAGPIELNDLWVRASVPGQINGAGYVEINNKSGQADRLVSVQSDAAARVELHTVLTENGVAKMRQVEGGVDVPAHGSARLSPGGFHVMFLQLTAPFKLGATIPVVLKFEKAGEVRVDSAVKPPTYNPASQGEHGMMTGDHAGMKH